MSSFFRELKRRNVVKVGIAYAAIGWLTVDIASVIFPIFEAPKWILQVFASIIVLGFPIALVLAWAYELTPEGLKRTDVVPPEQSIARRTGRQLDYIIIAVLALAVILLVTDKFLSQQNEPAAASSVAIAVLPFVNRSPEPEQEYFSDGLAEELLNRLARIEALRVPARTSSFHFKGEDIDVREVGRRLSVGYVLEGSVRKSGQSVRVVASLIDVSSGYHIWTDSYERELIDIFEIQDDITRNIVAALAIELDDDSAPRLQLRQIDLGAYELWLRGRYHWNQRSEEGLTKAIELFQEATRRDPDYAEAYAGLADAYLSRFDYGLSSWEASTFAARAAATKALELDERLASAHTSLAHILLHEWAWQAAEREFLRALELDPNYTLAHHWYALCLTALGRTDEAVQTMQRAHKLDPLSARINADVGMAYLAAGRYEEAVAQEGRTLELAPQSATARWIRGMAFEQMGRFDEAEADMRAVVEAWSRDASALSSLGHLLGVAGREAEARELLAELIAKDATGEVAFFIALVHAGLGEADEAFTWLGQAIDERSGSVRYLQVDARLAALRRDPRFPVLVARVGLPP